MALEATHIRFALDVKEKFNISDIAKYISGAVYPDSRYVTGIDRNLTHPKDFWDDYFFRESDFKKGWYVHLICDNVQWEISRKKFPEIFFAEQDSDRWTSHTALKVLQDLDDARKFDITGYLYCLDYFECPNGEDEQKMKEYNETFKQMYFDIEGLNINSCYKMWKQLGIGDKLTLVAKEKAEQFSRDHQKTILVSQIYQEMINYFNDSIFRF